MDDKSISVVIPCYNNWHLTHSLLLDVYKRLPPDTEVIVVDDCSTSDDVEVGLKWWKEGMLQGRMRTFRNEKNFGFLRTCNFGIPQAHHKVVALISNDVKLNSKDIYYNIWKILDVTTEPVLIGKTLYNFDTGWNTFDGRVYPYIDGSFMVFRKHEWLGFGGFDTRYIPFDVEDMDISTTYAENGGKLAAIDSDIVHLAAQTNKYSPEREAQTKRNQEKFRQKWVLKNG